MHDLSFSLKSMMDDFGRIFFYNGKIYRAISNDKKKYCLSLLNSELFKELSHKELIPKTCVSDLQLEGFELILEHEKLREILQHEWSFLMLKDAALLVLEVNSVCHKHGYELKDAHTFNVLFKGCNPKYVDIGSIEPRKHDSWIAYEEFLGSFIIPLNFWSQNKIYIARKLLESNFYKMSTIPYEDIIDSGLMKLLNEQTFPYKFKIFNKTIFQTCKSWRSLSIISKIINRTSRFIISRQAQIFSYTSTYNSTLTDIYRYETIEKWLQDLQSPTSDSQWKGYHTKFYNDSLGISYSKRFLKILELIQSKDREINSLIDLAGNEGYFCMLVKEQTDLEVIILTDYDANAVDSAYSEFKKANVRNVDTLLLNFMFTPDIEGTAKRLKCDIATALAVTHHLLLTSGFSIQAIFERLSLFSNRYVIVEFMPLGLWTKGDIAYPEVPNWYNVDWFRKEFKNYFSLLVEEQLEENRIVFMGEHKCNDQPD